LSKPCTGELDVLEYRAAHSKGTFIPPRSLFYIRQFIVEKILPKVEFLFYFLRRREQGFVSKINEIGMLWRLKGLARSLLLLLSLGWPDADC